MNYSTTRMFPVDDVKRALIIFTKTLPLMTQQRNCPQVNETAKQKTKESFHSFFLRLFSDRAPYEKLYLDAQQQNITKFKRNVSHQIVFADIRNWNGFLCVFSFRNLIHFHLVLDVQKAGLRSSSGSGSPNPLKQAFKALPKSVDFSETDEFIFNFVPIINSVPSSRCSFLERH